MGELKWTDFDHIYILLILKCILCTTGMDSCKHEHSVQGIRERTLQEQLKEETRGRYLVSLPVKSSVVQFNEFHPKLFERGCSVSVLLWGGSLCEDTHLTFMASWDLINVANSSMLQRMGGTPHSLGSSSVCAALFNILGHVCTIVESTAGCIAKECEFFENANSLRLWAK